MSGVTALQLLHKEVREVTEREGERERESETCQAGSGEIAGNKGGGTR